MNLTSVRAEAAIHFRNAACGSRPKCFACHHVSPNPHQRLRTLHATEQVKEGILHAFDAVDVSNLGDFAGASNAFLLPASKLVKQNDRVLLQFMREPATTNKLKIAASLLGSSLDELQRAVDLRLAGFCA